MHQPSLRHLPVLAALALPATAQSLVAPAGYLGVEGNSNNAFPWNWNSSNHYQQIYDSTHFTLQGATSPVLITRVRFRCDGGAAQPGGTYQNVQIQLSTAAVDYLAASGTFAANHGPDVTTVHTGAVVVAPGTGSTPGTWYIDIPLATSFLYDPSSGSDLVVDIALDRTGWSGTSAQCDAVGTSPTPPAPPACTRIYELTSHLSTSGTVHTDYGLVTEFTYVPAANAASTTAYGTGCYDRASASVYELFPSGTFDLSNASVSFVPTGTGYLVLPGSSQWWTPVGANLGLSDDTVSGAQPLGFTFPYPGGTTSSIWVGSNGFVFLQSSTAQGCCAGDPVALLSLEPRFSALWNDLNPGVGGTVVFDVDVPNATAYVTFTNVPEYGTGNLNTFQFALSATGSVEMRWQACSVLSHVVLTGWSPGNGARDPGGVDLSAAMPLITQPDQNAPRLTASPRPVIGNTVQLTCGPIPAGTPLGAMVLSLTQHNPGIDLTSMGMPGCWQYVGLDVAVAFFPSGPSGGIGAPIPNNASLSGVHMFAQAALFAAGSNPTGVITSNGMDLRVGLQ